MAREDVCPCCASKRIVEGRYLDQIGGGLGQNFRPKDIKHFAFGSTDVPISSKMNACVDCGHLWSVIDKSALLAVVEKNGSKELKNRILGEEV